MITFEQVEAEVRRLVAESPDHVYKPYTNKDNVRMCSYRAIPEQDIHACLFGQALTNLGVELTEDHENNPVQEVLSVLGISADDRQQRWAGNLQYRQDMKFEWGVALEEADCFFGKTFVAADVDG